MLQKQTVTSAKKVLFFFILNASTFESNPSLFPSFFRMFNNYPGKLILASSPSSSSASTAHAHFSIFIWPIQIRETSNAGFFIRFKTKTKQENRNKIFSCVTKFAFGFVDA